MSIASFLRDRFRGKAAEVPSVPKMQANANGLEAGRYSRRLSSFLPSRAHVNTLISGSGNTTIARARYMFRNNGYAKNAVNVFASALVGTGIQPSWEPEGVSEELIKETGKLWKRWCRYADAEGLTDFYGMQNRIARELMIASECFIRFRFRRQSDGLPVPFQLQILPSEMLDIGYTATLGNGFTVRQGVEFNPIGKRVAYHFWRSHPGDDTDVGNPAKGVRTRVPADEVLHVIDAEEGGQIRGLTKFSAALVKLWSLDQYDDAELERKKTAALFGGFITRPDPNGKMFDEYDENAGKEEEGEDTGAATIGLEPGSMHVLKIGEDVKFSEPADVGGGYEPFQYRTLLQVAVALGLPYFHLTGDLKSANYSSMRGGIIELRRRIEVLQYSVMVHQLCQPVWEMWFNQAVLAGLLPVTATQYLDDLYTYNDVEWITPSWEWVDPDKDITASTKAIDALLLPRSYVIRGMGYNPREVDRVIAQDKEREEKLGIKKKAPAPPVTGTPTTPEQEEDKQEDPEEQEEPEKKDETK